MQTTITFGGTNLGTLQFARKTGWSYSNMMYELRYYVVQATASKSAVKFTSLIPGNGGM